MKEMLLQAIPTTTLPLTPPLSLPRPRPQPLTLPGPLILPLTLQGVRPELPDGDDWRDTTTAGLAKLIEHCWQTAQGGRPSFGGAEGVVQPYP